MKHEERTNRTRYHGGRPPNAPARWPTNEIGADVPFAERPPAAYAGVGVGTEEVGLRLVPPSRYRSLLVPLDGSPFGEHALPLALGIARRAGASVRLAHVHSPLESALGAGRLYPDDGFRRRKQAYLGGLVRRLAKVTSVPVMPLLVEGREVASTLCEVAGAAADLVVMATHRRGLLGRLWHGSLADSLLRGVTAPLLLVKGYDAPVDMTGDPMPRHVLIPLDGSEAAERVLEPALGLGALAGARQSLLHVLELEPDSPAPDDIAWHRTDVMRARGEAWRYLENVAEIHGGRAARITPKLFVARGPMGSSILRYAETCDADLIALATSGGGALSRLFRGSVSERVARRATTPILVVRKSR